MAPYPRPPPSGLPPPLPDSRAELELEPGSPSAGAEGPGSLRPGECSPSRDAGTGPGRVAVCVAPTPGAEGEGEPTSGRRGHRVRPSLPRS